MKPKTRVTFIFLTISMILSPSWEITVSPINNKIVQQIHKVQKNETVIRVNEFEADSLPASQTQVIEIVKNRHYFVPIIQRVEVPVPQPYPVEVPRHIPVPVPQPYAVEVARAVPVAVPKPYAVRVPVAHPVPVPNYIPVGIPQPYAVHVTEQVPIAVPRPYAVHLPHPLSGYSQQNDGSRSYGRHNDERRPEDYDSYNDDD